MCSATEDSCCDDETPKATSRLHESKVSAMVKVKKAAWRSLFGAILMTMFGFIISCGHAYVCLMVFLLQCCLFGELVGVRKKIAAERKLPLFRSIQWLWFFVASFYTWSDGMFAYIKDNPMVVQLGSDEVMSWILSRSTMISFILYSGLLVISILCLRKGLYKYQITQYSWTLVTCCIVVFQMRAVFQSIYSGLFWFVLPCSLVICNDIMAYFCGVPFGRKFIKRPFLEISPNKTWEGFIGSAFCTLIFAWYFSKFLASTPLMVCVPARISFRLSAMSDSLNCTPAVVYQQQTLSALSIDVNHLWPVSRWLLGLLVTSYPKIGEMHVCVAQFHAMALSVFASFIAPFGGFLASAIKRAYGIKDFAAVIPGHGGLMDRFDCQFIMGMCTYVHMMTFCDNKAAPTVEGLLTAVGTLIQDDRDEFIRRLIANYKS